MQSIHDNRSLITVSKACVGFGVVRSAFYRWKNPPESPVSKSPRPSSPRALSTTEKEVVLTALHSDRFVNQSPGEIYHILLDEGVYHCSERTIYRILAENAEVRERRNQTTHPQYAAPQLTASQPNQVWSWDITKVLGPVKWTYYHLYVMLDIFSRFVVGWMVANRETGELATQFIAETCRNQGIQPGELTIHSDRGTSMRSKPVAFLLADLGITKTHSRPRVSNDNPFSESQFKTMKYRPDFPSQFGSLEDARAFCQDFFQWYNEEHRHSGIGYLTPAMVHSGYTEQVQTQRQQVLNAAYELHPERFVRKPPVVIPVPDKVWINRPEKIIIPGEKQSLVTL
jgi:putative transposase